MKKPIAIAIDGPAAAGKSTIAKRLAKELGVLYVDTGALYRSIGYYAVSRGADPGDPKQVVPLLGEINVRLFHREGEQHILLNGEDVTGLIRSPEMSMAASAVSAIPEVRAFLLDLQRETANEQSVVMDGRDIGTVVLPGAGLKVFLTASEEERTRRRYQEYLDRGEQVDYKELLAETRRRDENDSKRAAAPLRRAQDAVLIDSTSLSLDEVVARLVSLVKERI